ncbi:MAG: major capsid protein [Aeromonadaceae bacterium]
MSNVPLSAERTPHDLGRFVFTCGDIGRLKVIDATPVFAGDSYEADMVGSIRLSPLRRGLAIDSKVDVISFYIPHRHTYGFEWNQFMLDGVKAKPLSTVQLRSEGWGAGFLGTNLAEHNKAPKWLAEGYCRIFDNYFALPSSVTQSGQCLSREYAQWTDLEAAHGVQCCQLKNVWSAPLPQQVVQNTTIPMGDTLDLMGLNTASATLHTEQERDFFMKRYRDVMQSFGGSTHYDADQRPHMLMRSEFWASGYDVDGTDSQSLGQFSGRVQQAMNHRVPRFYVPEHGAIITVALMRFPPIHQRAIPYYIGRPDYTYVDFAGDTALDNNMAPRDIPFSEIFRGGAKNNHTHLAHGQWFRSIPDHVDERYMAIEGFPFLSHLPTSETTSAQINSPDYDQCFQTMQLRHWNAQIKTNVTVLRALPDARAAVLTNA